MKKKTIVVIYYGDDWTNKIPLQKALPTKTSFEDWHERGLKSNCHLFRASIKWYDDKKNVFEKAWAYRNKKWIKVSGPIKPDMIFDKIAGKRNYELLDKKLKICEKIKVFNYPLFRTILDNKLSQYVFLQEFMPKSYLATNEKELKAVTAKISTTKIVIKPLFGSGGFGIIIDEKTKALRHKFQFPVLVQEFINSRRGIPGFSRQKELADLRMVYMNHKLIYALSRIAKEGSLFTNFHQGATAILVPKKFIPRKAMKTASNIVKKLSVFPEANYSLDFIFTEKEKPLLIEMNTTPGFDLLNIVGNEKIKERNFQELLDIIN
ncbi:MAG TPA: ATP-grasp domain-containing protein [Candidatus Moranbacteria bacterium]|mgnify:CR=1 FL=1|nr:ATP-grasp domain-containing protein [Candidatus Moranbacteria bacterium]